MIRKTLSAIVLVSLSALAAAQAFGPAITINGVEISRAKVQAQTDHLVNQRGRGSGGITQPTAYQKIQEEVVEQIVVQELLWQEAQRRGIVVGDEEVDAEFNGLKGRFDSDLAFRFKIEEGGFTEKTFYENIRQQMSVRRMVDTDIKGAIVIEDADVEDFYKANIDEMAMPERVRARHILVKFDTADAASREAAEKKLADARARVDAGESFALVAIEMSEGPSSAQGGDLGFFARGQMVPAFEEAAFGGEPGSMVGPVETQFGLHLIKVEARSEAGTAAIEDVEAGIREHLAEQALYKGVENLVEELRAKGDVQVHLFD